MATENPQTTLVLGGGPAGLTAGYLLGKAGRDVVVLEAEDQVGGLAKTVEVDGYRFDLGGHRFFTKSVEVDTLWHEVLGEEFLLRPRMSRIFWNNRYLDYPLRGPDVIRKLGPVELARCMASYLRAAARRNKVDNSLEDWVSNRFGRRLFELFFKTYNEKVWGVPTSEIRAEWAAQRIKGLSFFSAAKAAFFGNKGNKVKSLISEFNYPRFGPGPDVGRDDRRRSRSRAARCGSSRPSTGSSSPATAWSRSRRPASAYTLPDAVISSLPLRDMVEMISPPPPQEVLDAARGLRYRDFLTVALVVDGEDLFPDNWIYIHEPSVQRRAHPELPLVVAVDGPGPRQGVRRARVLLLRRRRPLDDGRRRARRARVARARAARPRAALEGRARLRDARPEGLPDLRRRLRGARRVDPRAGSTGSRTCSRSGATACTATTTRTTRC